MNWLRERFGIARNIAQRRWVKVALLGWGLIAAYDTFVSQFVPESVSNRFPKIRELIAVTSGWLPWWGWLLCLAAIIAGACFEYAVRKSRPLVQPDKAGSADAHDKYLQIAIGEDGPFIEFPKHGLYGITRLLKVEVRNGDTHRALFQCKLQITDIEPPSGYRGPWVLKDGFSLAAGDQIFVPIASYGEARNPDKFNCADTLIILHAGDKELALPMENFLTLRATALDSPFCEIRCRIWVDEKGKLRISNVGGAALQSSSDRVFADQKTRELAGIVHALMERALRYDFKLPVTTNDPFLEYYREIEHSAHPIWTDREINQLRRDFLQYCAIIGRREEVQYTPVEQQANRKELQNFGRRLIAKLTGECI